MMLYCHANELLCSSSVCTLNLFAEAALEERDVRRAALEASLREVLFQIIKFVNEKRDHVPPIPNVEGVSFPYEITISR